jgi:hypothetical protein
MAEYDAAKGNAAPHERKADISPGTWRWLCVRYMAECTEYKRLDQRTRHVRKLILESTYDEPIAPGSSKFFRDMPLSKMTADAIETLRDRKLKFPEAANGRVKAIRQVFKFGIKKKDTGGKPYAASNPARESSISRPVRPAFTPGLSMTSSNTRRGTRLARRRVLRLRSWCSPDSGAPTSSASASNTRRAAS